MHKLSLDPSTSFGWCLYLDREELPERAEPYTVSELLFYGTWDLGKKKRRGQYYVNLKEQLTDLRRRHGIQEDDLEIVLEAEAYGARRTEASAALAAGWLAHLEEYCERRRMTYPITVTTTSWRAAFIGATKAPKDVVGDNARRKWLKDAVMAECARRKMHPKNDNEADAIGVMFWMVQGGKKRQDRMRAEKKAKTAEKRAQQKLELPVAA